MIFSPAADAKEQDVTMMKQLGACSAGPLVYFPSGAISLLIRANPATAHLSLEKLRKLAYPRKGSHSSKS